MYQSEPRIYELHINPTYAVHIPQYVPRATSKSIKRIENEKNLLNNRVKGVLSAKSQRKLINAVNWLVASAANKWIYDKNTDKRFYFKVNFITLTLPTLDHGISDHYFKSKLLHNFINACRYKYGLSNYVWKVETQANGNIHAHFTTDCFIHWQSLRDTWNKILSNHGILQHYTEKHKDMDFEKYVDLYSRQGTTEKQLRKAYNAGVSSNWLSPNTTDVKAVHKVNDIAGYLAKYLSKNDEERRLISGRLWSCSESLSHSNRLVLECPPGVNADMFQCLCQPEIQYKQIERVSALSGVISVVGEIFFYSNKHWGTVLTGSILEAYNKHRFKIRHHSTYTIPETYSHVSIAQPKNYILHVPKSRTVSAPLLNFNQNIGRS